MTNEIKEYRARSFSAVQKLKKFCKENKIKYGKDNNIKMSSGYIMRDYTIENLVRIILKNGYDIEDLPISIKRLKKIMQLNLLSDFKTSNNNHDDYLKENRIKMILWDL